MKIHPVALLHTFSAKLLLVLLPLGVWGVGALALLDASLVPIPGGMDGILTGYVAVNPHRFFLYSVAAALCASLGSLVPFYIGRAGGELFLLKRINRERYEKMRDRFERQEFFAILIPSLGPPPTPLKLFQFAAGVFEMKPLPFVVATFLGKLVQFTAWTLMVVFYGPAIVHTVARALRMHAGLAWGVLGLGLLALAVYVTRRIFDRRRGLRLPLEETADADDTQA